MPNKFEPGHSPPDDKSDCKADTDDPVARMSDITLRKKKNADAQAAFRQRSSPRLPHHPSSLIASLFRRANYIATLEETGLLPPSLSIPPLMISRPSHLPRVRRPSAPGLLSRGPPRGR